MNRALSPRDRGCGRGNPSRKSGSYRLVPGTSGLVRRIAHPPERETPPGESPAARGVRNEWKSGFDGVSAISLLCLGGRHSQSHLLADRTGQESPDGMRLPARRLHQFLGSCAARPLQQLQDLGRLAAIACGRSLFLALGRFLRRAGLLGRLGLFRRNVGALSRNVGLFVGFRLVTCSCGLGGASFFCNRCIHVVSYVGGDHRSHDMDHSGAPELQANSGAGDGMAMAFQSRQMSAGGSR
jgi:hypothetical protein